METTALEGKFFDFEKARVQVLTLDQLTRTHKENDVYGNPLRGIYHYALINQIIDMCKEFGYNSEIYDLFAAQNKDRNTPGVVLLPQIEAQLGERAVEAHILRRIFANIRLTDFDNEDYTTNLAVAFHQKGVQVGFGNMVKICHNQCMLGADHYAATYAERGKGRGNGMTLQQMFDAVRSWLMDSRHIVIDEREKIERMKSIDCSADMLFRIIGMLTAIRVKSDTSNKRIRSHEVYPLNQSQITSFTEALLVKYDTDNHITVWDLYNTATDLYKANGMDIPQMLPQNRAMVSFLEERFGL